jgi:hypothetical protein
MRATLSAVNGQLEGLRNPRFYHGRRRGWNEFVVILGSNEWFMFHGVIST